VLFGNLFRQNRLSQVSCLAIILSLGFVLNVRAQTVSLMEPKAESGAVKSFGPEYFKGFQVNTARDMVSKIPGFSLNGGDSNLRGYAGAAGNALINGQRPASKNDRLENILERIPASEVVRIDLISGGAEGIDMQGQAQVINIIRVAAQKPSTTFILGSDYWLRSEKAYPNLEIIYSRKDNDITSDANVKWALFNDDGATPGVRLTFAPNQALDPRPVVTLFDSKGGGRDDNYKFSQSRPLLGGRLAIAYGYNPNHYRFDAQFRDTDLAIQRYEDESTNHELSFQYEKNLAPKIKLENTLLLRRENKFESDIYTDSTGPSRFEGYENTEENIITSQLTWQPSEKLKYQIGYEYAYNALQSDSRFWQGVGNGPNFNRVNVDEKRNEVNVLTNYIITPKLTIEADLRVESSQISVKQSNRASSFIYPKPRLQLTYSLTPKLKLSAKVSRIVSQLNFGDFVASVDLVNNLTTQGNTKLEPSKEWQTQLDTQYEFWDNGSFGITLTRSNIEDTIDRIAIIDGAKVFDAVGNIGDGLTDRLRVKLKLPMDKLGLKGLTINSTIDWRDTEVTDPNSGLKRKRSGNDRQVNAGFEHNIPTKHIRWGMSYSKSSPRITFRANQFNRTEVEPYVEAYTEYTTQKKYVLKFVFQNLLDQKVKAENIFYQGLRVDGLVDQTQITTLNPERRIYAEVRKAF
jgi:hypothetical protein